MRLLFVEDHEAFATTVVEQFLRDYDVVICSSLADARTALSSALFDALLVDYDLADGKGDELVREIRGGGSTHRWTAMLAVSSHERGNAALLDEGANEVCPKTRFAEIAEKLARARPYPEPQSVAPPSPVVLAGVFAEWRQSLSHSARVELEELLRRLLFEDPDGWGCLRDGLITHTELRNLLLAHVATWLEHNGAPRVDRETFTLAVAPSLERRLFFVN